MTMNNQDRKALTDNWDQAKSQIRQQFPDVTDAELNQGRNDPDALVSAIAQRTGKSESQVESTLSSVARNS